MTCEHFVTTFTVNSGSLVVYGHDLIKTNQIKVFSRAISCF